MDLALYIVGGLVGILAIGVAAVSAFNLKHKGSYILWLSYFGVVLILFGIALLLQKRILESTETNTPTPKPLSISERPFVTAKAAVLDNDINDNDEQLISGRVIFTNSGATPAQYVVVRIRVSLIPPPLPEKPELPPMDSRLSRVIISPNNDYSQAFPGTDFVSGRMDSPLRINREQLELLIRDKLRLYVYGVVDYKDVLGEPHQTGFCFGYADLPLLKGCPENTFFN